MIEVYFITGFSVGIEFWKDLDGKTKTDVLLGIIGFTF